jgi:hypothetical protein
VKRKQTVQDSQVGDSDELYLVRCDAVYSEV